MASPLEVCTLEEQHAVIRFLVAEGVKPSEIFSRMFKQYGNSCMNRANFYQWIDRTITSKPAVVAEKQEANEKVKNGNVKKAKGKPIAESKEDKEESSKPEKKVVKRKGKVNEVTDKAKDENKTENPEKKTRKKPQEEDIEEKAVKTEDKEKSNK